MISLVGAATVTIFGLDTFTAWDVYITRELFRTLTATMTATDEPCTTT